MAQRRYGPTRGAGVGIIEQEGEKSIEPAALGWVGYAGILEKGPVGELSVVSNKTVFANRHGSYIEDSLFPDAAIDYFDAAAGAGGMLVVRVTNGDEVQAERTIYSRKVTDDTLVITATGKIKAKNGGRWGGKENYYTGDLSNIDKLEDITLDTEVSSFVTDQWKGGYIELSDVSNTQYQITGNTAAGVISVESDSTMLTDHSGGADLRYYLVLENEEKEVSVTIEDGEDSPSTEFALTVYVDGKYFKKYPNLNTDPTSANYWVSIINNDDSNDQIEVEDLVTGQHTASIRPANYYGVIDAITETVLTSKISNFAINSPVAEGDPTFALGTTDDDMLAQTITVTMTSATEGTVASDMFGDLGGTLTLGSLYTPNNKWSPPFTATAGGSPLIATDTLVITYSPFVPDSFINGFLFPDKANASLTKFRITDNDHDSITVSAGSDLTADGAIDDEFMVVAPLPLSNGIDGNTDIGDAGYNQQAWDVDTSPFNQIVNKQLGLVKFATPGITSTSIQKAGAAYVEAKNHQYRYEVPSATTTETSAQTYVNDTIGRSDFAVCTFPSYGYVSDPEASSSGKLKLVSATGMIHGREAKIAANYSGYHKAEAGIDAKLTKILKLPTGDTILNEEILNPVGLSVIVKKQGNFVIWGDRTLYTDPTWKFKHQREQMSYYEQVLMDNFDWIVFAINDPITDKQALIALHSFFRPEWVKRALSGRTFEEAAIIKVDSENNTAATRAAGDNYADISLALANTVERFIMRIGKQGIFESVG
jgi:hypothetical protein